MWRGMPLVRPGVWFCLLGSTLALVAYFLPYYGPPPGSLWELLRLYWSESDAPSGLIWLSVFLGSFLLLLVGLVVLAFLEVWPRLSSWKMTRWYRRLSILALIAYAAITLVGLSSFWLASILGGGFLQVTLGGWLLPLGLIFSLLGTIIQPSSAEGQPSERAPDGLLRPLFRRSPGQFVMLIVVALLLACSLLVAYQPMGEYQLLQSSITLSSISMVSATEGWAVGDYTDQQGHRQGRIYHYQAGVWKRDMVPSGSGSFTGVWMLSPQNGWAVGFVDLSQSSEGQIFHYQDGVWKQEALFPETSVLFKIQMLGTDEGWAVGAQGTILHYQQGNWTPQLSPTNQDLYDVFMLSPTEGWAVGFDTILHFHNMEWSAVSDPMPRDALQSISMVSPTQGWIVGLLGATLQYVDGVWVQMPTDTSAAQYGALFGVAMVSPSEGWAVGDGAIFHYLAGTWKPAVKLDVTVTLSAIAMVSAQEGWAVGYTEALSQSGIIMHYSQGRWEQVKVPDLAH